MSWQTNRWAVSVRSAARQIGITRFLSSIINRGGYEESFDAALLGLVEEGDCVWDVGANIGHYTLKLCEKVGPAGTVFAFEPSPQNRVVLERALARIDNAIVVPMALGKAVETSYLAQGNDEIGATSRLVSPTEPGAEMVQTTTGACAVAEGLARVPAVIKIDTEGYELDVLLGLGSLLRDKELKSIGVEVHFGLLNDRGMPETPKEIELLLASYGFVPAWTDPSHIVATRSA